MEPQPGTSHGGEPSTDRVTDDRGTTLEPCPGTSHGSERQEGWQEAESRKKKSKKKKKGPATTTTTDAGQRTETRPGGPRSGGNASKRSGAVLVIPKDGKTFADMVRTLRTVDTSGSNLAVRSVTQTRNGAVLIRTTGDGRTEEFSGRLRDALGDQGAIRNMTPKVTLEILDLDCLTQTEEVKDALDGLLGTDEYRRISVLGPNTRGQKMAICDLSSQDATKLLETGRIKIGFVSCRVRARLVVPRCYKCLGYGHLRTDCTGPDRHDCCWKCGSADHKAGACTETPACFLCTPQGGGGVAHVPGTARCAAFRAALTETRARQRTTRT